MMMMMMISSFKFHQQKAMHLEPSEGRMAAAGHCGSGCLVRALLLAHGPRCCQGGYCRLVGTGGVGWFGDVACNDVGDSCHDCITNEVVFMRYFNM